jgi:tetratricopeptide (TPR) repeat protein
MRVTMNAAPTEQTKEGSARSRVQAGRSRGRPSKENSSTSNDKSDHADAPFDGTSASNQRSEALLVAMQLVDAGTNLQERTPNAAFAKFQTALGHFEAAYKSKPDSDVGLALAATLCCLGDLLDRRGAQKEAEARYKRALQLAEEIHGPGHKETGPILDGLGNIALRQGRWEEAMQHYECALGVYGPTNPERVGTLNNMAILQERKGDLKEALAKHEDAVAIKQKEFGKNDPVLLSSLNGLAGVQQQLGMHEVALGNFKRALDIEQASGSAPTAMLASTLGSLAVLHEQHGHLDEAMDRFKEALAIKEAAFGSSSTAVACTLKNMAIVLSKQGRLDAAALRLQRALAIEVNEHGNSHPEVGKTLNNLGVLHYKHGRLQEAQEQFRRAQAVLESESGRDQSQAALASTLNNLGLVLQKKGKLQDALQKFRDALAMKEGVHDSDRPELASTLTNISIVLIQQGAVDGEPVDFLQRALAINEVTYDAGNPAVPRCMALLGCALGLAGKTDEAMGHLERAANLFQNIAGDVSTDEALALANMGDILLATPGASTSTAAVHFTRALRMLQELHGNEHPQAEYVLQRIDECGVKQKDVLDTVVQPVAANEPGEQDEGQVSTGGS